MWRRGLGNHRPVSVRLEFSALSVPSVVRRVFSGGSPVSLALGGLLLPGRAPCAGPLGSPVGSRIDLAWRRPVLRRPVVLSERGVGVWQIFA